MRIEYLNDPIHFYANLQTKTLKQDLAVSTESHSEHMNHNLYDIECHCMLFKNPINHWRLFYLSDRPLENGSVSKSWKQTKKMFRSGRCSDGNNFTRIDEIQCAAWHVQEFNRSRPLSAPITLDRYFVKYNKISLNITKFMKQGCYQCV